MMFEEFVNRYPVSKTLRFQLKPQGATLAFMNKNDVIGEDRRRAENYKKAKRIIDNYHRHFIDEALDGVELSNINSYKALYEMTNRSEQENKDLERCEDELRKEICTFFESQNDWKSLFKGELIKKILPAFVKTDDEKAVIKEFDHFATFFEGFHANRKAIYTSEKKKTGIAYRLINQNLPKFIDNSNILAKAKELIPESIKSAENELEEFLCGMTIEDVFNPDNYCSFLSQAGIDRYNQVIGGKTLEDGTTKVKGLNEYINLYNQTAEKKQRLGLLSPLYKQILSDRGTASFVPEKFDNDEDVLKAIKEFSESTDPVINSIDSLLDGLSEYDLDGVYVLNKNNVLSIMSQHLFDGYDVIRKGLEKEYDNKSKSKNKHSKIDPEKRAMAIKNTKSYSLSELTSAAGSDISEYFSGPQKTDLYSDYIDALESMKAFFSDNRASEISVKQNEECTEIIKRYLDSVKAFQTFVMPLLGTGTESPKDERFYSAFTYAYDILDIITPLYNKVRNYVTEKPYSEEKFKLTFSRGDFFNTWEPGYRTKSAVLFEKDGIYFLAVIPKKLNDEDVLYLSEGTCDANRLLIDVQTPDNKNTPRLFIRSKKDRFAPAVEKYNLPVESILDIYDNGKFKTKHKKESEEEFRKSMCELIDYFKLGFSRHESFKHYDFKWRDTVDYNSIDEFYNDTKNSCYRVIKEPINFSHLYEYANMGKVYLFQIYSKDFSEHSTGRPNLNTLYWRMLFDERNLADPVYKINGGAEIFFRASSINMDDATTHKAKKPLPNKNKNNQKKESVFDYPIVKDKRFTLDHFQIHVPITINFQAYRGEWLNKDARIALKQNKKPYVIGIDRGERNLLYICVIDHQGNIVEQRSLNEIVTTHNGNKYKTDYHDILQQREKERDEARRSWKTIKNIKELKEGYMSQAVHVVTELMLKYDAIIVLENLNKGFKNSRVKFEKQVYQTFERMLINKLNYLVFKGAQKDAAGGLLKGYQLTNKFESFEKLGMQCGFLFYIDPWNTSKLDPATGFVNLFDTRYKSVAASKDFWNKFEKIAYNPEKGYFEFSFDYSNFHKNVVDARRNWTVCSFGDRIRSFRNPEKNNGWDIVEVSITHEFIKLFTEHDINYRYGNLIEAITDINDVTFHKKLLELFKLTVQIRNSVPKTDIDYIISPVKDKNGEFFDSRDAGEEMPKDADANGAYNIARKGLMLINKIKATVNDDLEKANISVSRQEWLQYAQSEV